MVRILNGLLNILKMLMLLVCFVLTFYIIINMYRRLEKDLVESIANFIPFILLFVLFSINFILKQRVVNGNLFYNVTCCLVLGMLLFAIFRTLTDKNMIVMIRLGYDINFNYFADIIAPMKVMLYGLSVSNILLILSESRFLNPRVKDKKDDKEKVSSKKTKGIEEL